MKQTCEDDEKQSLETMNYIRKVMDERMYSVQEVKIREALSRVCLAQTGWEGDEDVVTFNGNPIGGTIRSRSIGIDRWWPALKDELATWIARELWEAKK